LTPKEFERQIAKIQSLLEGQQAEVRWDARIPDPDNPSQLRQVDILINRDGQTTLVECRHRFSPQDVTWIEELCGRKASLRASAVIAVSSSGFTRGALLKASALGVFVRDLANLTPEEIRDWGKGTRAYLEYVQFGRSEINLVVPVTTIASVTGQMFSHGNGDPWPIEMIFKGLANQLEGAQLREGVARVQNFPRDLYVGGLKIEELVVQAEYRRLQIPLLLPSVKIYGDPNSTQLEGGVYIENDGSSDFEIVRAPEGVFVVADLSVVEPLKNAIFRSILFDLGEETLVRGFAVVGEVRPWVDLLALTIRTIRRDSGQYLALLREGDLGPLIVLS
jgi:hypothetical protein